MNRLGILQAAKEKVSGDTCGAPEYNFERIAKFWTTYKGVSFTPADVAAMMALLKLARIVSSHDTADSWIDLAGYAACGGELIEFPEENEEPNERDVVFKKADLRRHG